MARIAGPELTKKCAQEIIWSQEDAIAGGAGFVDDWEYIDDYCACGPIADPEQDYEEFRLDPDEVYDAMQAIRRGK